MDCSLGRSLTSYSVGRRIGIILPRLEFILYNSYVRYSFLLHFYQPFFQSEHVFRKIVAESYAPLIKLVKNKKKLKLTINMPLSTLELLDRYGHSSIISDIKVLSESGKVELVGSAAYHNLLTKTPKSINEQAVILNEYALGYYLGKRTGFEGESATMFKGIRGFFAPELAVNKEVVQFVEELGYEWLLVDPTAIKDFWDGGSVPSKLCKLADSELVLVSRDKVLSDLVAFKRNSDVRDLGPFIAGDAVVSVDAETFGHHNVNGLLLLENLIELISDQGGEIVTISEYISYFATEPIGEVCESTWAASLQNSDPYVYWSSEENELQVALWKTLRTLWNHFEGMTYNEITQFEVYPVWDSSVVNFNSGSTDTNLVLFNLLLVNVLKVSSSDQFWWSSRKKIFDSPILFNKSIISSYIDMYRSIMNLDTIKDTRDLKSLLEIVEDRLQKE